MTEITIQNSKSVRRVSWRPLSEDELIGEATVTFANGRSYRYEGVPLSVFADVVQAAEMGESVGSFVNRAIVKGGYDYERVEK